MAISFPEKLNFANKIMLSVLSGNEFEISLTNGAKLETFEINFLSLVQKITTGTKYRLNKNKNLFSFTPGVVTNGSKLTHKCDLSKSMAFYVLPLIVLSSFGSEPIEISLTGLLSNNGETSVYSIRSVFLKTLERFGQSSVDLKVIKTWGELPRLKLSLKPVKAFKSAELVSMGLIERIRGTAFTASVPTSLASRMVYSAKGVFHEFLPDVWISTDCESSSEGGRKEYAVEGELDQSKKKMFGISLVAEFNSGCFLSADGVNSADESTEMVAKKTALKLLKEIEKGGAVNEGFQDILLVIMAICPEDISRIKLGALNESTKEVLRGIKEFFGVFFKVSREEKEGAFILSVRGAGFTNLERKEF